MENTNNVLFVDAETSMLESIKRFVIEAGQSSYFAEDINGALEILKSHEIDVMFVDITRNNLSELLDMVQNSYPNVVKVVISDYAHLTTIINSIRRLNLHSFLLKPWRKQELLDTISSSMEYAKYLKVRNREKENLEQKNAIYQRIINFKDDVGETNKQDINSLKTSMFILASEYEKLFKDLDGKDLEISLRSLYNASEIYTSSMPSFIEKFKANEVIRQLHIANAVFMDNTNDFEFVKNLSLIKEYASRVCKYLENFMGANNIKLTFEKANEQDLTLKLESNFRSELKKELVLFFEYLKQIYNTNSIKLHHEIYDDGNMIVTITL